MRDVSGLIIVRGNVQISDGGFKKKDNNMRAFCFVMSLLVIALTSVTSLAQAPITLYSFCPQSNCPGGNSPRASLIQGSDGNFYGTTFSGGTHGAGAVFEITQNGTLSILWNFCSQTNCTDGGHPIAGLILATDGNFYGTTTSGGRGYGTVFKLPPNGTLTTIHNFCSQSGCADGADPVAGLVQAADGNFYGTTFGGGLKTQLVCIGTNGCGVVYKLMPNGMFNVLHSFCSQPNCPDGAIPQAALIQASDGNLYGTTYTGGSGANCGPDCGTVFRITTSGVLTTIYNFCTQYACSDGSAPESPVMQATDGNLYGTTTGFGSAPQVGTVFEITLPGLVFNNLGNVDNKSQAGLIQATDGNLYGTTFTGGTGNCNTRGCGTIFKLSLGGTPSVIANFDGTDGAEPVAALLQSSDGNFYGTTEAGGTYSLGTVFSFIGPNPTPVEFVPLAPCRVVDTRNPNGPLGGPPIQGRTFRSFALPQGACDIPATAVAYSLNVTAVPHGPLGYLTIWPTSHNQPVVSTMNSLDGRVKANAAIVPGGADGAVSVYVTNTTDVILDIDGYFILAGSQTYQFYPLAPCRLVDTRNGDGGPLQPGVERDYTIAGQCGIPSTATAYSFNVTVLPTHGSLDYLTVWPEGGSRPIVSTLNDPTGTVVANAAIVPAGTNNATAFYAHDNPANLLLDVNGYFAPPDTGGLSLYPVLPCRVLDTRQVGNGNPFVGELTVNVSGSSCPPPGTAKAYVFNATVVPPGSMPYLTLWPNGQQQPTVSTLNAYDGFITSNMAIVPTTNGFIDAYAAGLTQLLLDISGYFAP